MAASSWGYDHLRESDYVVLAPLFGFGNDIYGFKMFAADQQRKHEKRQHGKFIGSIPRESIDAL